MILQEIITVIGSIIMNPKWLWAIVSIVFALVCIVSLIRFHMSNHKFDLISLFAFDQATGVLSDSKFRLNTAFVVMTWAFVYITMQDKLTEWYVVVYAGAWVTDRFLARYMGNKDGAPK